MKEKYLTKVSHGGRRQLDESYALCAACDFSVNINPFVPPFDWNPADTDFSEYPDDSYMRIKEAAALTFGCRAADITVGNGSIEVIRTFFSTILEHGDAVVTAEHTFGEYARAVTLAGGCTTHDNTAQHRARVICNPNNPDGALMSRSELLAAAEEENRKGSILFVDEAFSELSEGAESVTADAAVKEGLFVNRSLTKSFAAPGLRIGFGIGAPDIIEEMEIRRLPWTMNAYAESFALAALKNFNRLSESRRLIAEERRRICSSLDELCIEYMPSAANYILLNLKRDSGEFTKEMLKHGIFVRDCASFGLPESIRIAVRKPEENDMLIEALSKCWH